MFGRLIQSVFKRKPAPDAIRGGYRFASRKRVKTNKWSLGSDSIGTEKALAVSASGRIVYFNFPRHIAFSSEVDTGSRQENASKQRSRASVPIQSERKRL